MSNQQNFDVSTAKFSGRGTQMMSRFGAATISHWMCFKTGYSDEELKLTGLSQPCSDQKYQSHLNKDPYSTVKNKVETNVLTKLSKSGEYP